MPAISAFLINTVIPFVQEKILSTVKKKAESAIKKKTTGIIDYIFPKDDYAIALNKIILNTIENYEKTYPPTGNFPFYHHKETFAQLSKFILFKDEGNNILETINFHELDNIEKPTAEQLEHFYNFFVVAVQANDKLKYFYIEENYQSKIFDIYRELSLIKNIIEDFIKRIPQSEAILKQWIDMIYGNLRNLKISTALDEINQFEKEVLPTLEVSDRNKAFMYFVKGLCLNENAKPQEAIDYFEQACLLDPSEQSYKAWHLYFCYLFRKSDELLATVNSALKANPFDPMLNSIQVMEALEKNNVFTPQGIALSVQNNIRFKRVIYRYYLNKNLIHLALSYYQNDAENLDKQLKSVTIDNFGYLDFYLQLYFIRLLSKYPNNLFFVINPNLRNSPELDACVNYFSAFLQKIADSEKKLPKAQYEYLYRIAMFMKEGDKDNLNKAYAIYKENKGIISPFYFNLLKFGFSQAGEFETALKIFDESEIVPEEHFFKFVLCERLNQKENSLKCLRDYFKALKTIDDHNVEITLEAILNSEISFGDLEEFYNNITNNTISTTGIFRDIIIATKGLKDPAQKEASIKIIESNYKTINDDQPGNDEVIDAYCRVLYNYEMWQGVIAILDSRNIEDSLKRKSLYIDALWHSKLNSTKLIQLLEQLRNSNLPQHDKYYIWEIKLNFLLGAWDKVYEIAAKGRGLFSSGKSFDYYLAVSLVNLDRKDEFIALFKEIDIMIYEFENFRTFCQGMLHFQEYKTAIELIYNYVVKTKNPEAKNLFFSAFLFNYDKILTQSPLFCESGYVIQIKSQNKTLFVNEVEHTDIFKKLIDKRVGETLSLPAPMTGVNVDYKIMAILHKFDVLLGEIQKEAENPELTGLPMFAFKLTEGGSLEEWNQQLMDLFGKSGDERQMFIEKSVNYYKNGQISFLQLTRSVFNDDVLDAYLTMTNSPEIGYRVIPSGIHRKINPAYQGQFCLDLQTVLFFSEQSEAFNIVSEKKFIISTHTLEYIEGLLYNFEKSPASDMSMNITSKGVIPRFDGKVHIENKIEILKKAKAWIEQNCEVQTSPKKLDFLVHFQKDKDALNAFVLSYLDSISLSVEHNIPLVSDEKIVFAILREGDLFITTEGYLKAFQNVNPVALYNLLSERNYVGIEIPLETIESAVIKAMDEKAPGHENLLLNLSLKNMLNTGNILTMIRIMQEVLGKEIAEGDKTAIIEKLFTNLLDGSYSNQDILQNIVSLIQLALYKLYFENKEKYNTISKELFTVLTKNGIKIENGNDH